MRDKSNYRADRGPRLGALLRLAHQVFVGRIMGELTGAGINGIQPAHFAATQVLWDHPDGVRLTALAKEAKITKQAMGELIDHLVSLGYVERVRDSRDGRARLIRLTASGLKAARRLRKLVRETEIELPKSVGSKRIESMRETLKMLVEIDSPRTGVRESKDDLK